MPPTFSSEQSLNSQSQSNYDFHHAQTTQKTRREFALQFEENSNQQTNWILCSSNEHDYLTVFLGNFVCFRCNIGSTFEMIRNSKRLLKLGRNRFGTFSTEIRLRVFPHNCQYLNNWISARLGTEPGSALAQLGLGLLTFASLGNNLARC